MTSTEDLLVLRVSTSSDDFANERGEDELNSRLNSVREPADSGEMKSAVMCNDSRNVVASSVPDKSEPRANQPKAGGTTRTVDYMELDTDEDVFNFSDVDTVDTFDENLFLDEKTPTSMLRAEIDKNDSSLNPALSETESDKKDRVQWRIGHMGQPWKYVNYKPSRPSTKTSDGNQLESSDCPGGDRSRSLESNRATPISDCDTDSRPMETSNDTLGAKPNGKCNDSMGPVCDTNKSTAAHQLPIVLTGSSDCSVATLNPSAISTDMVDNLKLIMQVLQEENMPKGASPASPFPLVQSQNVGGHSDNSIEATCFREDHNCEEEGGGQSYTFGNTQKPVSFMDRLKLSPPQTTTVVAEPKSLRILSSGLILGPVLVDLNSNAQRLSEVMQQTQCSQLSSGRILGPVSGTPSNNGRTNLTASRNQFENDESGSEHVSQRSPASLTLSDLDNRSRPSSGSIFLRASTVVVGSSHHPLAVTSNYQDNVNNFSTCLSPTDTIDLCDDASSDRPTILDEDDRATGYRSDEESPEVGEEGNRYADYSSLQRNQPTEINGGERWNAVEPMTPSGTICVDLEDVSMPTPPVDDFYLELLRRLAAMHDGSESDTSTVDYNLEDCEPDPVDRRICIKELKDYGDSCRYESAIMDDDEMKYLYSNESDEEKDLDLVCDNSADNSVSNPIPLQDENESINISYRHSQAGSPVHKQLDHQEETRLHQPQFLEVAHAAPIKPPGEEPFISEDPAENIDNNNPEWQLMANQLMADNDDVRSSMVMRRWGTIMAPDPNQHLQRQIYRKRYQSGTKRALPPGPKDGPTAKRQRTKSNVTITAYVRQRHRRLVEMQDKTTQLLRKCHNQRLEDMRRLGYTNGDQEFEKEVDQLKQATSTLRNDLDHGIQKLANAKKEYASFEKYYAASKDASCNFNETLTEYQIQENKEFDKMYELYDTFYK